ncbi:MAG: methyltransferase domain-containing protein [Ktedonobacteraceae bacterium]|nr:methyltransferase domain-containing protein [Ktedonobacteraceae bacterium]
MSWLTHQRQGESGEASALQTRGVVITNAWRYDLRLWLGNLLSGGKLQTLRNMTADLAELRSGETVLDVGCGTGALALVACERIGAAGRMVGIDPSPQMIASARRKAKRAKRAIDFQLGVIEHLPFSDQSCDAVMATMMMHQLPDDLQRQGLSEIARILKPGGRVVVVDTKRPDGQHQGQSAQPVRTLPWESSLQDQPQLLKEVGFSQIEAGDTGFQFRGFEIGFVRARKS